MAGSFFPQGAPAFAKGEIVFTLEDGPVLGFERKFGNETIVCYFNMSSGRKRWQSRKACWKTLTGHGFEANLTDAQIVLPAWGAFFARVQ